MRTASKIWITAIISSAAMLLAVVPASADTPDFDQNPVRFTVNNAADIGDANPGDGRCEIAVEQAGKSIEPQTLTTVPKGGKDTPFKTIPTLYPPITPDEPSAAGGRCTLRAAVEESNANSDSPHLVTLPSSLGVYRLTEGPLDIRGSIKVIRDFSPGSKRAAINAGHKSRIFEVYVPGAFLAIDGLFLSQGLGGNRGCCDGGAILVSRGGEVEINRSVIVHSRGRAGGAVSVGTGGSLKARLTSFESNHADEYGGAIRALGYVHLDRVSIYNNTSVLGGGIYLDNLEDTGFWMENSSVLNNTATEAGGGIYFDGKSFSGMVHSTVSGNSAADGGGYYQDQWSSERMVMAHSILADNVDTRNPSSADASPDCFGGTSTDGVNFFGSVGSACWGHDPSEDIVGSIGSPIDPRLEAVRISTDANSRGDGGELAYRRPGFGSPVLNLVQVSRCIYDNDMIRDNVRVLVNCDLGAIER